EGIEGESSNIQIDQFLSDLSTQTYRVKLAAKNWREVFQGLGEIISTGRHILVFDEFPWMAAERTNIISDLKLYWDRWSMTNKNIVLFLCGSVANFMVKHIVHSKALHNRKTLEICLGSLSPQESAAFIKHRGTHEKAMLYMCLGGIPKYLEQIDPSLSIEKNLNQLCFSANGFFLEEYDTLFKEQFRSIKIYQSIVELLSKYSMGMSDIANEIKISKGGGLSGYLQNLTRAQFVREYKPISLPNIYNTSNTKNALKANFDNFKTKTRTQKYKLIDYFLIFYFRYIHLNKNLIKRNVQGVNLFKSITYSSFDQYLGFTFERFCEDSLLSILKASHIDLTDIENMGPYFQRKSFNSFSTINTRSNHQPTTSSSNSGVQIDYLIWRKDKVCSVAEFKYHHKPIGMEVVHSVKQKIEKLNLPSKISIEKILVAANGVTSGVKNSKYFQHILTLDDLL
ncbi:MAG: hypothetical protein HQK51_02990, partial [Oligoflexia bacterium]|nr:hypothetical protein [Oligoflexia bacterium]